MRADGRCGRCGAPVRYAVQVDIAGEHGETFLDPVPVADGDVWVEWFDCGTPFVLRATDNRRVPAREPFRYRLHSC
jgi:hypothetical protein